MTDYQVMPPLAPDEYAALEASIRERGVLEPVPVDEDGAIIDGYHRSEIAQRLGVDWPTRVVAGLTDAEKRTMAFELNLNRRHLNREQKRRLVAASLKADPQLSDREHARRTGVTHPTVAAVSRELQQTGDVENLSTRIDSLGREQPVPTRTRNYVWRDRELSADADELMQLRWHWTLDESNPERVSFAEYAAAVGTDESKIAVDANGWAEYLKANRDTPAPACDHHRTHFCRECGGLADFDEDGELVEWGNINDGALAPDRQWLLDRFAEDQCTITIPATIEDLKARAVEMDAEEERLDRIKFELLLARFHYAPEGSAARNAYLFGLLTNHHARWARWIEDHKA